MSLTLQRVIVPVGLVGAGLCLWGVLAVGQAGQTGKQAAPIATFHATTEVVLVNLTVHDKNGGLIRDLKPSEVTLREDGKIQKILSFDYENLATLPVVTSAAAEAGPEGLMIAGTPEAKAATKALAASAAVTGETYPDRRLMVLYFDLTTMQPEDVENAVEQAQAFIRKNMQPADLVAVATLGNSLQVNQDFTDSKTALLNQLTALNPATSQGFADGSDGSTDGTPDDGNSFTADDTEFNVANADRSLEAIQTLSEMLGPIKQKKSVLFFSDGISRSGVDNELTLRSAVNAAVKADVALYSVDARGLQVRIPGGSANSASARGQGAYTSGSVLSALGGQFSQQETVATLANDTGGQAFLDSNDFAPAYARVQADTQSYYLISYRSSNPAQDGRYRKISITLNDRPGARADARPGYYAGRDFAHLSSEDRRQQLMDQLTSDVPEQTLPLYANDGYLRLGANRYYIPVAIAIPGANIPLQGAKKNATPTVDIDGMVRDRALRQIGHIQDSIPLNRRLTGTDPAAIQSKNLQFTTGFIVTPGVYEIRLAARENQTGGMGAFGTVVSIPDLATLEQKSPSALAMSSVMIGSQLAPARPNRADPLTVSGMALVPSVTHVFATNQQMYVYYEIYDPKPGADGAVNVATNVAFYRGKVRVFQTTLQHLRRLTDPARQALVVQLAIPLDKLPPGYYTCQVNALDDNAVRYAFPRLPILVRAPEPPKAP